jgi:hypothetical protein
MRRLIYASTVAAALALVVPVAHGQMNQDADRVVPGGGVLVTGWKGKIVDASSIQQGRKIEDSKFAGTPDNITLNSGPGGIYWNPANTATGDYTITATFNEPKVKSAMSHEHPYGIFIGGNGLDTDNFSLTYCAAYATGKFIFRGFGPAPFAMGGRAAIANPAIHMTGADGAVTQEIAMSVKGDKVSCSVNGTEVASYPKAELVGAGKLTSTDGLFGIRISHNTDVIIKGFKKQ